MRGTQLVRKISATIIPTGCRQMLFRITGLDPTQFKAFTTMDDAQLAARSMQRMIVTSKPGFPDRIALRDCELGESVLLLNFQHQPADTPYRSCHAIFIAESSTQRFDAVDVVPEVLRSRGLSVRGFDRKHHMVDADLVEGQALDAAIAQFFQNSAVAYLQLHYAKRGCFAARVDRAG